MEKSTIFYGVIAILFTLCALANLHSMLRQVKEMDEVHLRSKRDVEDDFIQEALAEHNKLRAKHGSPPLQVDKSLCPKAVTWAKKLADDSEKAGKISMVHSKTKDVGENIGLCKCKEWTAEKISNAWYDEIKVFNWSNNFFNFKTGHFTQLIWKKTKTFCIARHTSGKFSSAVAHYYPRGNEAYRSSFKTNVVPLLTDLLTAKPGSELVIHNG